MRVPDILPDQETMGHTNSTQISPHQAVCQLSPPRPPPESLTAWAEERVWGCSGEKKWLQREWLLGIFAPLADCSTSKQSGMDSGHGMNWVSTKRWNGWIRGTRLPDTFQKPVWTEKTGNTSRGNRGSMTVRVFFSIPSSQLPWLDFERIEGFASKSSWNEGIRSWGTRKFQE